MLGNIWQQERRMGGKSEGDQEEAIIRFYDMTMVSEQKQLSLGWTGEDGIFFFLIYCS